MSACYTIELNMKFNKIKENSPGSIGRGMNP